MEQEFYPIPEAKKAQIQQWLEENARRKEDSKKKSRRKREQALTAPRSPTKTEIYQEVRKTNRALLPWEDVIRNLAAEPNRQKAAWAASILFWNFEFTDLEPFVDEYNPNLCNRVSHEELKRFIEHLGFNGLARTIDVEQPQAV